MKLMPLPKPKMTISRQMVPSMGEIWLLPFVWLLRYTLGFMEILIQYTFWLVVVIFQFLWYGSISGARWIGDRIAESIDRQR